MQKSTVASSRSILMSSADRAAISMGNSCNYCGVIHALPAEYNAQLIKPSNSLTNVCWLRFNNIFCAATNFGCIDSFLLPNSSEEMMGDEPLVLLLPVCFEQ